MLSVRLLILVLFSLIYNQFVMAQTPMIRANSKTVSIKDGEEFKKDYWTINPKIKKDTYYSSNIGSKVTFYTDVDSISATVNPNQPFVFSIFLENKKALTEVAYFPSYREILKKAAAYNFNDNRELPLFNYQSAENKHLKQLRLKYNIDSIAGTGDEISKILNVLEWIHKKISHDGQHANPKAKNADEMISVCSTEQRGLNCRGLAITLNECYLSLGFRSRYVTCWPKDSLNIDRDVHVINSVFVNSLNKWIWIDPTNNAYVMNDKNDILSIEEVRESIILNKPLKINKEANYNQVKPVSIDSYLYHYMAKNLYILECPLSSEFNYESRSLLKVMSHKFKFLRLLPIDSQNQKEHRFWGFYKTNNPNVFWAKP
ncbi:MAG: transglutaminase-like domain-containing protein [Salinivirgaceae bacterium]